MQPAFSPRRLRVWNTKTGAAICDLNFVTAVLAVRMNRQRYVGGALDDMLSPQCQC